MTEKRSEQKQQEEFKNQLLDIKETILHDIQNMTSVNTEGSDATEENAGHGLHMADFATDMYDREFNLGLASNDRELLGKVEKALKRLKDGTYGTCLHCKCEIAPARLHAIPYVETCLKCQEKLEKRV